MRFPVTDIMTDPVFCTPEMPLPAVARLMAAHGCREIPVVDGPESRILLGVLTESDIVRRAIAMNRNPRQTPAGEIMSAPAISVSDQADVDECSEIMERCRLHHLPVVDARGKILGLVSRDPCEGSLKIWPLIDPLRMGVR
jgi:CBS domain-containing protein